jgi:beta-lactamase superfamily II metal-dependent hydrolase
MEAPMSIVKSFAVGNGDMFFVQHNSDNFTIIDCNLTEDTAEKRIDELKLHSRSKGITRFISTHPDQDHIGGIELLDAKIPLANFYVTQNQVTKGDETESFKHYCGLRDNRAKAYYIYKGCMRKWLNQPSDGRDGSGISVLWPDTNNVDFKEALAKANAGESPNNISAVVRYCVQGGASVMWLGDLETEFMNRIADDIVLEKTTIIFAAHHGRSSGKIPNSWLEKLDPQIIVIGEAPSRHLNYYTGYSTLTQNRAGDITMELVDDKVHFYVENAQYKPTGFNHEGKLAFPNYIGSITVESEYTLQSKAA